MPSASRLYITEDDRSGRIIEVTGMATIGRAVLRYFAPAAGYQADR